MESTSATLATTKYITEPRVATGRYFSRAAVIFSSVISASFNRVLITPEVTWGEVHIIIQSLRVCYTKQTNKQTNKQKTTTTTATITTKPERSFMLNL